MRDSRFDRRPFAQKFAILTALIAVPMRAVSAPITGDEDEVEFSTSCRSDMS